MFTRQNGVQQVQLILLKLDKLRRRSKCVLFNRPNAKGIDEYYETRNVYVVDSIPAAGIVRSVDKNPGSRDPTF